MRIILKKRLGRTTLEAALNEVTMPRFERFRRMPTGQNFLSNRRKLDYAGGLMSDRETYSILPVAFRIVSPTSTTTTTTRAKREPGVRTGQAKAESQATNRASMPRNTAPSRAQGPEAIRPKNRKTASRMGTSQRGIACSLISSGALKRSRAGLNPPGGGVAGLGCCC